MFTRILNHDGRKTFLVVTLLMLLSASAAFAQTASFTYQGRLTDGSTPANGSYDIQFALFDAASGGMQIGSTLTRSSVNVAGGIFTVQLDFGASAFPGPDRFLEIAVRQHSADPNNPAYTMLLPRQQLTSTPYAIRSGNAALADTATNSTQLGGVAANQYVQTNDSRLTDARPPTPASSNYIQNTNSPQASSNFNISGNGVVGGNLIANGSVGVGTLSPGDILHLQRAGSASILLDVGATSNTGQLHIKRGSGDSYVGPTGSGFYDFWTFENIPIRIAQNGTPRIFVDTNGNAGIGTTSPSAKLDVAGPINTTTQYNIGGSRMLSAAGTDNIFAGVGVGAFNTGLSNTFVGAFSGQYNTTGSHNTLVGYAAGQTSYSFPDGSGNTFIGSNSHGDIAITNATAIGNNAQVDQSNSLVLGSINNVNAATADTNVGIGTTKPSKRLHVVANGIVGIYGQNTNTSRVGNQPGVYGLGNVEDGVWAISTSGNGLYAQSSTGSAGYFNGDVFISGNLIKGSGSFKIDHPLDPANKYLYHSFVESPDMMNIYNGNVTTDEKGEATITLPDYFEALNRDFRYQLTVIGQFAQAIVASEIKDNRFQIKTDKPTVKVSWQVTGIRQDAWANAHRIPVVEHKPEKERGTYLHPELFGQPKEKGVQLANSPTSMRRVVTPSSRQQQ